jgi:hypothetical protein
VYKSSFTSTPSSYPGPVRRARRNVAAKAAEIARHIIQIPLSRNSHESVFQNSCCDGIIARHERVHACPRCPLGSNRAAAAEGATKAQGWSPPSSGSCRPRWHHFRPAHWLSLAAPPRRTRLWERLDLLATVAQLARRGVWQQLHETLLNWLGDEATIDLSRASLAPSTPSWWIGTAPPGRPALGLQRA